MFLCPSSPNTDHQRSDVNATDGRHHFGRSDYAGNRGEAGLRCGNEADCPNRHDRGWGGGRGVLLAADDPSVSIESIADGTAQTLMIGEAPESIHGYWAGPWNFFAQRVPINARLARAGDTRWAACVVPAGSVGVVGRLGCDDGQAFHSYHPGGSHFVLADGSARYFRETLSPQVLAALLSRDGGEIVSDE